MPKSSANLPIADLFCVRRRFFRSTHLERDFDDVTALDGYVIGTQITEPIQRLVAGLQPAAGQRAWRLTGDYGVGKSSFALLLAHLLSPGRKLAFQRLGKSAHLLSRDLLTTPKLLPILVTGSRRADGTRFSESGGVLALGLVDR